MSLPVSVCVPLALDRGIVFDTLCFPSIEANDPAEILIESHGRNANVKRNAAARKATQPFLFFCDDDVVMLPECLRELLRTLEGDRRASYAYCDYLCVNHPRRKMDIARARRFDANELKRRNFISTMSLIRREHFPGFDESIERFQDYDLWLTLLGQRRVGVYYELRPLFAALYFGDTITQRGGFGEALRVVHDKHGIETR